MTVLAIDRCPMKACRVRVSMPRPARAYPAECRNMWAWIGNGSLAASPNRSMSFWAPSIDKGALRSLRNRNRLCARHFRGSAAGSSAQSADRSSNWLMLGQFLPVIEGPDTLYAGGHYEDGHSGTSTILRIHFRRLIPHTHRPVNLLDCDDGFLRQTDLVSEFSKLRLGGRDSLNVTLDRVNYRL